MPFCNNHMLSLAQGIYSCDAIAEIQCQLSPCSGYSFSQSDHLKTIYQSSLRKIKKASSEEKREKASAVLFCLLSDISEITVLGKDVYNSVLSLCKKGLLNRKLLYGALVGRPELDTLTTLLDYERPFLRNDMHGHENLSIVCGDIFVELFLITVRKQQHWLLFLLDTMLSNLKERKLEQVETILSHPALQFLLPLSFLQILESQNEFLSLKFAAEHTIASQESDPCIKGLAKKILWYLIVLLWLKENNVVHQTLSGVFSSTVSTLSLINQCCDIASLDWKKTHEFLVKQSLEGHVAAWEISLFDTFIACALAFDYILCCLHSKHTNDEYDKDGKVAHLDQLQIILNQLQPFALRLKIMEKIFSLLFLQYEDFQEDTYSDSEEGEIDVNQSLQYYNGETETKSLHVLSSSMTSITILADHNTSRESLIKTASEKHANECKDWHQYHQKHGFVCDRYMTRDMLKLLDVCLTDISSSRAPMYALKNEVLQQFRSFRSRISVALWKLETLLGPDFIHQSNSSKVPGDKVYLPDWVFQHSFDEDSASDEESLHITVSNIGLRRADAEKSSESSSQSNLAGQGQGLGSRWNRRSLHRSSVRFCARGRKDTIIKRMLSSDQSLVTQCLSKGHCDTAKNVAETLELGDSEVFTEVNFIHAYQTLKHKVVAWAEESTKLHQSTGSKSQNSTLLAIQRAASAGVQTSSLNKEVEKLLSDKLLPRVSDVDHISEDFLHLFGGSSEEQPIVAAAVDVALMLASNVHQTASFLNTASKYSHQLQNFQVTGAGRSRPVGFHPLIQSILQVPIADFLSPSELLLRWDVPNFSSRSLKDALQFCDTLAKLMTELRISSSYVSLYPKFLQLVSFSPVNKISENKEECYYLQDFKSYLRLLSNCKDRSSAVLPADLPLTEEHFMLLQQGPYKLLADVIFEVGGISKNLESVASLLGCNIPNLLSNELCLSLPSVPPARTNSNSTLGGSRGGVQVLNCFSTIGPARHPVLVVEMLLLSVLSELSRQLCLVRKLSFTPETGHLITSQVNVKQMESIFALTWELRHLDLKQLQPGAETLVFYCNLANLMWIHALVILSNTSDFSYACLQYLVYGSSVQKLAAMSSLAYEVGSAGTLTLWEVRRLALGVHLMRPAGTRALQECSLVTDSFDALTLFVISTGTKYSPKLRVLHPENLEEQLQQSAQEYVEHWTHVQSADVTVPSLVHQYIESTGQSMQTFLKNHLDPLFSDKLNSLADDFQCSCFPSDSTLSIVMEYGIKYLVEVPEKNTSKMFWRSNVNLCKNVLNYIKSHSPIVSLLLEELLKEFPSESDFESDEEAQEATEATVTSSVFSTTLEQYSCLDRLCKRSDVATLCKIFDSNTLLCALHNMVPDQLLWESINYLVGERKWESILDFLKAIPPLQLQSDPLLLFIVDLALFEVAIESRNVGRPWLSCEQMNSVYLLAKCVISESSHWPGKICVDRLRKIVSNTEMNSYPTLLSQAIDLMNSITIYQDIIDHCEESPWTSWQEVQVASQRSPMCVLNQILGNQNADICVSWIALHNISVIHPCLIDCKLHAVTQLLQSMPIKKAAKLCFQVIHELRKLTSYQFCVHFLVEHCMHELNEQHKNALEVVSLGIQMVNAVPASIQIECVGLIHTPHLIIEQLVMNMQLEAAEQMLNSVQSDLIKLPAKSPLAISALDSILRQYAERALEFRISQGPTTCQSSDNDALLTSLSSHSTSKDGHMPLVVPSKAEWVPNEHATVCMNCQVSVFTMFNRRHHCRRCGRVVCAQCSPHKSLVDSYGSLKVRVCISCQTKITEADVAQDFDQLTYMTSGSNASFPADNVWRLSSSLAGNETIRGEFAYEHAPSVSLCLSILKLHSKSAACPNFLVDACEMILNYLQPQGGMPNPEVDYAFVIEMCRSLVLAAKVKCAQWGYVSDEPNCDQRLSKIDLLGLLVSHGCTSMIPNETTTHGLRRLQSQLIETELWELALEVSTKSGMEKIGVWTSWGKGCLRAGRWKEAREKFVHCFPVSSRINKSAPDSPLLADILQILESTAHIVDEDAVRKAEAVHLSSNRLVRTPAVVVLHTLASLKNVSQGKFTQSQSAGGSLQTHVYSECCYYFREYGSHATYLQFLVRHSDFKACVDHTLSVSVDAQVFFESVYMPCLRRGQITPLHSAMTTVDSSLAVWTAYLHGICAALERRKLLHTLYEVQQWSKDHVRAAMTCIRFYHLNAKSYSDLAVNLNHLMRAQSHLEGALAVASASRKASQSSSRSKIEGPESMWLQLTPKEIDHHMSTVERQKELTKFLSGYEVAGPTDRTLYEAAHWFPHAYAEPLAHGLPTLFGSTAERKLLAGLCLFCGKNVEEGYGIVYRIIEGFNLSAYEIYEAVAVALCHSSRVPEVAQLLNCIRSSGLPEPSVVCDSVLLACLRAMPHPPNANDIDFLARNISDHVVKIKAFIACGQLKSAYLLAVKSGRLDDIEQILIEADRLGQDAIKKICLNRLGRK